MIRSVLAPTALVLILAAAGITSGDASDESKELASESAEASGEAHEAKENLAPMSVAEARRQASLLSETYMATLHVIHQQYFDTNLRDIVPPRALEDVFKQIDERTKGRTRWISVNTPAMNVDHDPKPGFEKDAANALNGGSKEFERIENGLYHRAAAVPLFASCNRCHLSALSSRRTGRVAGLVITLPIQEK